MAEITDPTSRLVAARIRAIRTAQEITLTDLANRLRLDGPASDRVPLAARTYRGFSAYRSGY